MTAQDIPNKNRKPRPASTKGASDAATPASVWKKKAVGGTLVDVPSGNKALIRMPGMAVFLEKGLIPNSLMPIIQKAMAAGQAPSEAEMSSMVTDPEALKDVIALADAVTLYCCIDPHLEEAPRDEDGSLIPVGDARRDDNVLYVDEMEFDDRMYIFNLAVGGTADLEKFRQ